MYSTLKSWIDKYYKLQANYSEGVKNIVDNYVDMNITNHTVYNYTGRHIKLFKIYKNEKNQFSSEGVKKLSDIPESKTIFNCFY